MAQQIKWGGGEGGGQSWGGKERENKEKKLERKRNAYKFWQNGISSEKKKKVSLPVLDTPVYKSFVPVTLLIVINMHYNFSGFETVSFGVQGEQVCVGTGEKQKN